MSFDRASVPTNRSESETTQPTVEADLPRDLPEPAQMAQILAARPDRQAMLLQLQRTAGNAYVQQVMRAAQPIDGEPMTLGTVEGTQDTPPVPDLVVTVRIPPNPTQDQVRDAILRGPAFGFQDSDLATFHQALAKNPDLFFLAPDKAPKDHATSKQIDSWANVTTRLANIPISGAVVATLEAMKAGRATGAIDGVLALAEPELRATLRPLLLALLGPGGGARNAAASNLANLIEVGENGKPIAAILGALGAKGYATDPMVAALRGLANAKSAETPAGFVGPTVRPGILDEQRAAAAEQDANLAKTDLRTQRESGGVDRAESATVYDLTSRLYEKTGNVGAANQAAMMSRMFAVDDNERAEVTRQRKTSIDVVPPGTRAMVATSETSQEIGEVREEREKLLQQWEREAGITEVPETPPSLEAQSERFALSDGTVIAERGGGYNLASGIIALLVLVLRYKTANDRTNIMARLRDREAKLTRKAWIESHFPVPPRPEKLEELAHQLDKVAGRGGPYAAKAREDAASTREYLEVSRAFWALP
jgi:hypothetical protein